MFDRTYGKRGVFMSDFEVHPIGTYTEIKYSRELANEIELITQQYGNGIVPNSVLNAYLKLRQHYAVQIATENL
jgi:hypothetical protein